MIYDSPKSPDGLAFQGRAMARCKGFWSGGYAMEEQLVRPGRAAHNRRGKAYVFAEGDVQLTHLVCMVGDWYT
jgi:hypothetical protein